jgi:hypothetical protein
MTAENPNRPLAPQADAGKAALRASAIGLPITLRDRFGRTQTHQAAAGDREDGYLAFVTRYLGPQRQGATSLNTAAAGG